MGIVKSNIFKGSVILMVTFGIFNFLNYIYHFSMARLLTVAEYGVVATLFSIIYIFGIFTESIQTVITKYSSQYNDLSKLKNIFRRSRLKAFKLSLKIFIFYLVLSLALSPLLKISYSLLALTGAMIFTAFLLPVTRGLMQGRKMFKALGINMVLESTIKLGSAILLVLLGWRVYGAMAGAVFGTLGALFLSFPLLRDITKAKEKPTPVHDIYSYSLPVLALTFTILALYSLDIIIAKMMFDATTAGEYAIASILAKTIFFGTYPIAKAMFPLSAQKKKREAIVIFKNALILMSLCILAALLIFFFFPGFIILIFSGKVISSSSSILIYLALSTSILSFANLYILYKLSRGMIEGYEYCVFFIIFEVTLLIYFSNNLLSFSLAFLISSAFFLLWALTFLREKL